MNSQREMPRYKCHKKVWALEIKSICQNESDSTPVDTGWTLEPADEGYAPFTVSSEWVRRHNPQPGGYYVVYEDGYKSYSPRDAFKDGYTLIT